MTESEKPDVYLAHGTSVPVEGFEKPDVEVGDWRLAPTDGDKQVPPSYQRYIIDLKATIADRDNTITEITRMLNQAERERDRLRTALIDALSHEPKHNADLDDDYCGGCGNYQRLDERDDTAIQHPDWCWTLKARAALGEALSLTTQIGVDIEALTSAATNIGIRNASPSPTGAEGAQ